MRIFGRNFLFGAPTSTEAPDVEKHGTTSDSNVSLDDLPPKLVKFQQQIGIYSPGLLTTSTLARPAVNEGIYKRTVREEQKVKRRYNLSSNAVNAFFLLQIVVGAALTALGAAGGPSGAVTVLGALNTVVAGLLTYLKGQGLPQRVEQYRHLLRSLREHIEKREREFLEPDCPLDVDEEIDRTEKMYQEVRQSAQDNAPGNVLPPRGIINSILKKPDINRSDVPAPLGDKSASSVFKTGMQDLSIIRDTATSAPKSELQKAKHEVEELRDEAIGIETIAKDTLQRLTGHHHEGEKSSSADDKSKQ
ncbi:uncharacterized protein KY384_004393 [Bacidia gigantensis]|uniref:uncharacterized protein n=1 Tax=Bacidia gigantensis TaxID=2732470 RepID=UPI001D05BEE2|nr:uncharacterized protein KY384_004393 [Bacidia gigantensis]KAG8531036.1 hypothetical protein KY384_004393 [Bacidia gigantensis]